MIAAVPPQIMQYKLANYYPVGSSVEAATTPSRRHVIANSVDDPEYYVLRFTTERDSLFVGYEEIKARLIDND
jgi:hypothetical protein